MVTSSELARIVLSFNSCSHKKLQKLCYYVYSWYLTVNVQKICNINFEAWVHGPVSPDIYFEYSNWGWNNIPKYSGFLPINDQTYSFVSKVVDFYSKFTADELEEMTHNEEPWKMARNGCGKYEPTNTIIRDNDIISYYRNSKLFYCFVSEMVI